MRRVTPQPIIGNDLSASLLDRFREYSVALNQCADHRLSEFVSITGTYTAGQNDHVIECAPSGAMTVTLPAASVMRNKRIVIKRTNNTTHTVTIQSSSGNIDGSASVTLTTAHQSREVFSDGANWWLLDTGATAPTDPYWANVVLMLHFESGMTDSSPAGMVFSKVGGGSNGPASGGKWGAGEYAIVDDIAYHNTTGFGSAFTIEDDYTVECWVRYSGAGRSGVGNFAGAYSSAAFQLALNSSYQLTGNFIISGTSYNAAVTTAINDGLWHHYAVVRSGVSLFRFLDGVLEHTANCGTGSSATPTNFYVGRNAPLDYAFVDIDDLRITKGIARYTSDFDVPTSAFPDS